MLSLAQIAAKYSLEPRPPKLHQNKRIRLSEPERDEEDPDWIAYKNEIREEENRVEEVSEHLRKELQRKGKEPGAKCVEYLRKLIVKTNQLSNRLVMDKSMKAIFYTLFKIAQAAWSLPSQVMDDLVAIGGSVVKDCSSRMLAEYLETFALEQMRDNDKDSVLNNRWIELFVKFVSVLGERGDIPHDGDKVNGKMYKEFVVEEIARMDWTKQIVKSYLTILEEIPGLEAYSMDVILEKFGQTLHSMAPALIHNCVYQIVSITGALRPGAVLMIFDKYFVAVLKKSNLESNKEKQQQQHAPPRKGPGKGVLTTVSLGSVVCHLIDACRHCESLIREVQKRVKSSLFDHTLVTSPFMLAAALAMTSIDYMRVPIVDSLKIMILKSFHEIHMSRDTAWYHEIVGEIPDNITDCFTLAMNEGSSAMEFMSDGLRDIGLGLLNCGHLQNRFPNTYKTAQELGTYLVTTVVTKNKEQLGVVLKELLRPESSAHIECLANCLNQCVRQLGQRDFQGRVTELLHHLPSMSVESASVIVKSLMPSLQISPTLLDELMIVLRKTFWKSVETGRICVEVICVILSNSYVVGNSQILGALDVPDDLIFSQCIPSNSRGSSIDYSPLCREILNLGKRFFLLDCKVREQLYLGLHRVARRNPIVNDIIAGQLHAHSLQYIDKTAEVIVSYSKIFEFSPNADCKATVKDELGFLVQCMGFVYNKTYQSTDKFNDSMHEAASFANCKEVLENFIEFACNVELNKIEYTLSDIIGASGIRTDDIIRFVRGVVCVQTLQIMEALIEFLALSPDWPQARQKISRISKRYEELDKYLKASPDRDKAKGNKGKKGRGKAKKDNTTSISLRTQADTDAISVTTGSKGTGVTGKPKKLNLLKSPKMFHIMNLDSICQMLRELYGPEEDLKHLSRLRSNDAFELILLSTVKDKVYLLSKRQGIRERQRAPIDSLNSLTCLAETIWGKLSNLGQGQGHGTQNASVEGTSIVEARLDIIATLLEFLYSEGHYSRILYFSKYEMGRVRDEAKFCKEFFEQWKKVVAMVSRRFNGANGSGNPFLLHIMDSVCKVCSSRSFLHEVMNWCWLYHKDDTNTGGTTILMQEVIAVLLTCSSKICDLQSKTFQAQQKLARKVRTVLGTVDPAYLYQTPEGEASDSWLITKDSAEDLLKCISNHVETQISMLNTILGRLKAHHQYLGNERSNGMREQCILVIQGLRQIITPLIQSGFPSGPCVQAMIKLVTNYYSFLANFTDHLIDVNKFATADPVSASSFKVVVKDLGMDFKPLVETMILYIELIQRKKAQTIPHDGKKKNTRLANAVRNQYSKETKLIPNMVYHMERFDQLVIALSKKTKIDMVVGMKLSNPRDIRIDTTKLYAMFNKGNEEEQPEGADARGPQPGPSTSTTAANKSQLNKKKR